jgi:DNA-binding FadR family transcriptional regulator
MRRKTKAEKLAFIERLKLIRESVPLVDEAALKKAEAPLVKALRKAGFNVTSVWDFVNTKDTYPEAVSILLQHLRKPYPRRILEGIARALAVREARVGWDQLVRHYCSDHEIDAHRDVNELKWSLHLAVAVATDESVLDELISLACDRRHGYHRSYFVDALSRFDDDRARAALIELRSDPFLKDAFEQLDKKSKRRAQSDH